MTELAFLCRRLDSLLLHVLERSFIAGYKSRDSLTSKNQVKKLGLLELPYYRNQKWVHSQEAEEGRFGLRPNGMLGAIRFLGRHLRWRKRWWRCYGGIHFLDGSMLNHDL